MIQSLGWLVFTIIIYWVSKRLYRFFPRVYFTPLLVAPVVVIASMAASGATFAQYDEGAGWLTKLVEPATIALAITLYRHMDILKKNVWAIAISVSAGAVTAIVTSAGLALGLGLDTVVMESLAPRSATTPIAIAVSDSIGGVPTITAVATLITGLIGLMAGPLVVKWCSIKSSVARGILFGTSAHSAGISKALEYDMATGSVASIAMMATAFVTLLAAPWLVQLFSYFAGL
jgi:predicted murein hydrolase (TIGR00659 family)